MDNDDQSDMNSHRKLFEDFFKQKSITAHKPRDHMRGRKQENVEDC